MNPTRKSILPQVGQGLSLTAGLLAGAAALVGMSEQAIADDVKIKASIGGTEQFFNLDDPRIVREVVPAQSGPGVQTNIWVKTGERSVRSSIEYQVPATGGTVTAVQYPLDTPAHTSHGLEVAWTNKSFVIESWAARVNPIYGEVNSYNGTTYPEDATRFFAVNFYTFKTKENAQTYRIVPQGGASQPNSLPGIRQVERYDTQNATLAVSQEGSQLTWTDEGDGKFLIRAAHAGSVVMNGIGYGTFTPETPYSYGFAGLKLYTTDAPVIPEMRSIFVSSSVFLYNDAKPSWINAGNAKHLPMSFTLAEVTPGETVTVADPNPVITGFKPGVEAGSWSFNFYPGVPPNGYGVQCSTNLNTFNTWQEAVLLSGTATNAVIKPPVGMENAPSLFFRLLKP